MPENSAAQDPLALHLEGVRLARLRLECMRDDLAQGRPPAPAELAALIAQARAGLAEVTGLLGLQDEALLEEVTDPAALEALGLALALGMDLMRLSLELTRSLGPAYLGLPGRE